MNFEGWEIRIEFLDHDGYENHSREFFGEWEAQLLSTLKMLVFQCGYMPRVGEWIDAGDEKDGMHIGEINFLQSKEITFWMTFNNNNKAATKQIAI